MNRLLLFALAASLSVPLGLPAKSNPAALRGEYLESRTCDVFTGPCVANGEMGHAGKEAILVWSIREGAWKGVELAGLSVIAVVRTDATLGDQTYQPRSGRAVLVVDAKASPQQQAALREVAQSLAGGLIGEVIETRSVPMEVSLGTCTKSGCAKVKAGNLVTVATRCLGDHDHLCGNEDQYYPPLTRIEGARPAFTEVAAYHGNALNATWEAAGQRGTYLGQFAQ